jgi:hypothetical protein
MRPLLSQKRGRASVLPRSSNRSSKSILLGCFWGDAAELSDLPCAVAAAGCKLVVFRERDNHRKMYAGMTRLQRVETTFRMGLKGGVHVLFDENKPITIGNVFIDGEEQYWGGFGRTFDINRTLIRLAQEKRSYVSFLGQPRLIPQRSDPAKIEAHQNPDDSEFFAALRRFDRWGTISLLLSKQKTCPVHGESAMQRAAVTRTRESGANGTKPLL